MTTAITQRIAAVRADPGSQGRDLRIVPVFGPSHAAPAYHLLDEATLPRVRIAEVSDAGRVPELRVENDLDAPVFLMDGQELVGAKQNRILNADVLVPAAATCTVPVSCVEQGRWHRVSPTFRPGRSAGHRTRSAKQSRVHASLRRGGGHDADQGAVWAEVAASLTAVGAASPTSALADAYATRDEELAAFRRTVAIPDGAVGLAVFHGDAFQGLDLFDRHATLRHYWDSLVDSYAIDWLGRPATASAVAGGDAVTEAVRRVLARAAAGRWEAFDAPGSGADWRLADAELVGSALVAGETVVHLQLFKAGPRPVPPLPFPRTWWIDPGKVLGGCFPGTPDPARSRDMFAALVDAGVRTVVNLQEPEERGAGGRPFPDYRPVLAEVAAERGVSVSFHRFPIPDCGVPDAAVMSEIQGVLRRTVDDGRLAYVHCWGGHGRTGTVGGCWLVDGGLTPTEAFHSMKAGRAYDPHLRKEDAPQTDGQRAFVEGWARRAGRHSRPDPG